MNGVLTALHRFRPSGAALARNGATDTPERRRPPFPCRLLVLLAGALALAARPAPVAAQRQLDICAEQPVPEGYVVVAAWRAQQCPGFHASNNPNTLRIRVPGDTVSTCSAYPASLPAHVVVAAYRAQHCPGFYATNDPNVHVLRVPGDTVTACAAFTPRLDGYVVVSSYRTQVCPGFYASTHPNTISFRRLEGGGSRRAPGADTGAPLGMLDRHEVYVMRALRRAADELGVGAPSHRVWTGSLRASQQGETSLLLDAGVPYTLLAACDRDCDRMEVAVSGVDGRWADAAGADGEAEIQLPAGSGAPQRVQLRMQGCRAEPCHFAVTVHRAARGVRPPARRPTSRDAAPADDDDDSPPARR